MVLSTTRVREGVICALAFVLFVLVQPVFSKPPGRHLPNDPLFPGQWALENTGQEVNGQIGDKDADISATDAWRISRGSDATMVALLDTGVDYNHPDLKANLWSAPKAFTVKVNGVRIRCPKGSHGINILTMSCDPLDDNGRGTQLAGVIGAVGDNGVGVTGVNWKTKIVAIKMLTAGASGNLGNAAAAIDVALQIKKIRGLGLANLRVISTHFYTSTQSTLVEEAIAKAGDNDVLVVAVAGNSGTRNIDLSPVTPGSLPNANLITVLATDNVDEKAESSNHGPESVDLGAPGSPILTTNLGGGYHASGGTELAAAFVSGAAALILSKCDLGTAELKAAILDNVDEVPGLVGLCATDGRLNLDRALRSCKKRKP